MGKNPHRAGLAGGGLRGVAGGGSSRAGAAAALGLGGASGLNEKIHSTPTHITLESTKR